MFVVNGLTHLITTARTGYTSDRKFDHNLNYGWMVFRWDDANGSEFPEGTAERAVDDVLRPLRVEYKITYLTTKKRSMSPIHTDDRYRKCAINIPIVLDPLSYFCYYDDTDQLVSHAPILQPTLINTSVRHAADNRASKEDRVLFSIGIKSHTYQEMLYICQWGINARQNTNGVGSGSS